MVSEFKWYEGIPSGQRTYETASCLIRKTIKSIELVNADGSSIDLFSKNNDIEENDKLIFITAAIGAFCGIKNSLYAGYVVSSRINRLSWYMKYQDCYLRIKWNSEGKKDITCGVYNLMTTVEYLDNFLKLSGSYVSSN